MEDAQRLSALDAHFLQLEETGVHMHVGVVLLFSAGPLRLSDGRLDFDRIRDFIASQIHRVPRYRQRLAFVPIAGNPVWVDDPHFNLLYHVRQTALPAPGDLRQLKRLAGLLLSQKLDRGKPLWEIWVVEGVEGDRFALIAKTHHCMVDGIAGVDVLASVLRPEPGTEIPEPRPWRPRPVPPPRRLLAAELAHLAADRRRMLAEAAGGLARPLESLASIGRGTRDLAEALLEGLHSASPTPLNPECVGPHRRFDWTRFDLDAVKEIRRRLEGTLNDVVLATTCGAVRAFLERRGVRPRELDFRVMCPVNVRTGPGDALGNRVLMMVAPLPLEERDPRRRLQRIATATRALKRSGRIHGTELLEQIGEHTTAAFVTETMRMAVRQRSFNLIVTNVPGPPLPLYLLEAPLLESYPVVPLYRNQALGIALFSYCGGLYWGLNSDWDRVPDLHDLVGDLAASFEELSKAAGL